MNRRSFLKTILAGGAALALPAPLIDQEELRRFWPGFGPGTAKAAGLDPQLTRISMQYGPTGTTSAYTFDDTMAEFMRRVALAPAYKPRPTYDAGLEAIAFDGIAVPEDEYWGNRQHWINEMTPEIRPERSIEQAVADEARSRARLQRDLAAFGVVQVGDSWVVDQQGVTRFDAHGRAVAGMSRNSPSFDRVVAAINARSL